MPNPSVVLATAGYDHTVRFWEATRGVCYRTLQYADSQVNKLEITPDKRYLAAAGNPHIRLFEVNTQNLQPVTSYDGHQGNVTAVGFERDGRWMYSGSDDGTVKIWDLRAGGYQREYESRGAVTVSLFLFIFRISFYFIRAIRLTSCFVHHSAACYTRTAPSSSAATRTATCACGTSHRTRARASSYRRLASRCAA